MLKNSLTLLSIWLKSVGGGFWVVFVMFSFFFLLVRLRSNLGSGTSYWLILGLGLGLMN